MLRLIQFKGLITITLTLSLATFTFFPGANAAGDSQDQTPQTDPPNAQTEASTNSTVSIPAGPPIMWEDPVDIENLDMFYGPGGAEHAPDVSKPFTYVRRSTNGTQKKIIVTDADGEEWTVKFGYEARPETAATRIVWAAGYHVDEDYFVPRAQIVGVRRIDARNVRFERHRDGYKDVGIWSWAHNPFMGTRELDGLKVLMALLNNWDLKTINNKIIVRKKDPGPSVYFVADLGATLGLNHTILNKTLLFGDMPPLIDFSTGKTKGNPSRFANQGFIKEVRGNRVYFNTYRTRIRRVIDGVSVENARWIGCILGRLSHKQLADAFCASGFSPAETDLYVSVLLSRIFELQRL